MVSSFTIFLILLANLWVVFTFLLDIGMWGNFEE